MIKEAEKAMITLEKTFVRLTESLNDENIGIHDTGKVVEYISNTFSLMEQIANKLKKHSWD